MLQKFMLQFFLFLIVVTSCLTTSLFAQPDATTHALLHDAMSPVAGNQKGKITLVEFFDYQCSHCMAMAPVVANIIKNNGNLRVVFKEFPIRGPISDFASRAALAANLQDKYYAFNHALLTSTQDLSENVIFDIAAQVGLNVAQLKKDMDSSAIKREISANNTLADKLNLPGTPAFFVGKTNATTISSLKYLPGEVSQNELQDAINHS